MLLLLALLLSYDLLVPVLSTLIDLIAPWSENSGLLDFWRIC